MKDRKNLKLFCVEQKGEISDVEKNGKEITESLKDKKEIRQKKEISKSKRVFIAFFKL